jgi:hypothetical protein
MGPNQHPVRDRIALHTYTAEREGHLLLLLLLLLLLQQQLGP